MNNSKKFLAMPEDVDPQSYLIQIYQKVNSGKKLVTVHQWFDENFTPKMIYGKISVFGNILYFHSLYSHCPGDGDEYIIFEDLKKLLPSSSFRVFLKFSTDSEINRMIMVNPSNSVLVPQFIRFCMGENGVSYKGKTYEEIKACDFSAHNVNYVFDSDEYISFDFSACKNVVRGLPKGGFYFSTFPSIPMFGYPRSKNKSNLIGFLEDFSSAHDTSEIKDEHLLLDCGIAFIL